MIGSVVILCTGNICRSPVAAAAIKSLMPDMAVTSAGLHAVTGRSADPNSRAAAEIFGLSVDGHIARQFTPEMGQAADLILVMEQTHRKEIAQLWPQFLSKTFLLGHFEDGKQIADPYRKGSMLHIHMAAQVLESARCWAIRLGNR